MEGGNSWNFSDFTISGGELILAVARIFEGSFGAKPDMAKLNLLLFLMEGDGGIRSDLLFMNTNFGPKSGYLQDFVVTNKDLITARAYGKKPQNKNIDPDLRKKVQLTGSGRKIADRAIRSLSARDMKTLSQILSKWGKEKNSEILTYLCIFYPDFCTGIERKEDPKSLSD